MTDSLPFWVFLVSIRRVKTKFPFLQQDASKTFRKPAELLLKTIKTIASLLEIKIEITGG